MNPDDDLRKMRGQTGAEPVARAPAAARGGSTPLKAARSQRTNQEEPDLETLLAPPEQVLSTLNRDGTRRWLRPRVSRGRFLTARRLVAYFLIVIFALIPHVDLYGKPLILVDVAHRRFTFFGATFLPTDTALLALFMLGTFIAVFLLTALLGRVWCGWACPQTVYLEFLYRPLERLFDGVGGRGGPTGQPRSGWRSALLYLCYLVVSLFLAHTFLSYFVGVEALERWVRQSPLEHPGSFAVMVVTTGLMMFNFCYFREQTCIVACPYGRFQSVLLDRDSLIISYDELRGEPRGKLRHRDGAPAPTGDCVDCGLCVVTCPTGIDIRKGLQMECVGCAQCIDACDAVMDKVKRPRGLIRYTSQARLRGERGRILRGRVGVYSLAFLVVAGAFSALLVAWPTATVEVLRGLGLPYSELPDGSVANPVRIKIQNRSERAAAYAVNIEGLDGARLRLEPNPIRIEAGHAHTASALIIRERSTVKASAVECRIRVRDEANFDTAVRFLLLGPPPGAEQPHATP